ncbi:hypothetical protein NB311A_00690 [Nitrobacter sp. Nb-311A]|nr:hypothetical protein NB311A_00690 [Nitrobacter sp. Nb-311A]
MQLPMVQQSITIYQVITDTEPAVLGTI